MTNDSATRGGSSNLFDGWRSISIALFMALVGYSVMVSVPVLSTAWVGMLGFTEVDDVLGPGKTIKCVLDANVEAQRTTRGGHLVRAVEELGGEPLSQDS